MGMSGGISMSNYSKHLMEPKIVHRMEPLWPSVPPPVCLSMTADQKVTDVYLCCPRTKIRAEELKQNAMYDLLYLKYVTSKIGKQMLATVNVENRPRDLLLPARYNLTKEAVRALVQSSTVKLKYIGPTQQRSHGYELIDTSSCYG